MTSDSWRTIKIKDIGRVITGKTPSSENPEHFGVSVPFITPSDMDGRRTIDKPLRYLSKEGTSALKRLIVPHGVGVSCIGWQMGKSVLITQPSVTNQQINSVIPNEGIVDNLFLYYALAPRRDEFFRLAAGGSRTPILKKSDFEQLPFVLPPLDEQKAIAHILGTLDDKIELNQQMNQTLESIARALFKSWFIDFDPVRAKLDGRQPAGMDAETAALFPDEFEDSAIGQIPKGWKVGTLKDVCENPKRTIQPSQIPVGTPYIGLEHMPRKSIALTNWGLADSVESNKFQFKQGDILFGKLRPYFHKVGVAIQDGVCSTDILVIAPKRPESFSLILSYVSSEAFVDYTNMSSDGTRMPRTNWQVMGKYPIVIPSAVISEAFNNTVLPLVQAIRCNIFQSNSLATIRDALLPKLLSGEIYVKEVEKLVGVIA